ncbi:hypothetical protein L1987_50418 [Smallanthus sonchifolius]|uniref:Uncharacterized protein n=1 Tax=Smallanthus sonchifolius TaxID=185202 RepID=A0ACB9EMT4_9ASTR|nr:hypothetical protein L1987_50418 [Smallanthus sonchifolius]
MLLLWGNYLIIYAVKMVLTQVLVFESVRTSTGVQLYKHHLATVLWGLVPLNWRQVDHIFSFTRSSF